MNFFRPCKSLVQLATRSNFEHVFNFSQIRVEHVNARIWPLHPFRQIPNRAEKANIVVSLTQRRKSASHARLDQYQLRVVPIA